MKELIKVIVLLGLHKPKYYVDILNVDTGKVLKKNYSKEEILAEVSTGEDIVDWFGKLSIQEYQAVLYLSNGNSRIFKGSHYINIETNTIQQPPTTVPMLQNKTTMYGGLKGSEVPQLLANEILYNHLKTDFTVLKNKYRKQKTTNEKLKEKLIKTKNKLLFSGLENNKKTFLETEAGQGLVGAIPQILEALNPTVAKVGLNAAEREEKEKLTGQQKAFIEFIKTLSDAEILNINTLYKKYLKEKQLVENLQTQTNNAKA